MGINPTPYFNTAWSSGYGGRRQQSSTARSRAGALCLAGADAPMPEDEPQFGSLWEHIAASGKGVLNYGEGLEIEGNAEIDGAAPEGQRLLLNAPLLKPIFESSRPAATPRSTSASPTSSEWPSSSATSASGWRAGTVPALIVIRLPDDHTADPRPQDGYPYRASYVADNDLALGRIVAFLSGTLDLEGFGCLCDRGRCAEGVDHVDAHRSVLLVASPWVKPGAVSHQHTSMGSITRTIDELLGLGPMNLEDALAGEIGGIFDTQPHFEHVPAETRRTRELCPAKAQICEAEDEGRGGGSAGYGRCRRDPASKWKSRREFAQAERRMKPPVAFNSGRVHDMRGSGKKQLRAEIPDVGCLSIQETVTKHV